ncbi:MAG: hypothetical protein WCW84_11330 [Sulfurimonas sp.]|jgi:hypothetical protein
MAKVVMLSSNKCVVLEARNIGFLRAVKDIASSELEGLEALAEEAVIDANKALPEGFEATSVDVQVFNESKDVFVKVFAQKSE